MKKNRGITMVALVITIVVLLIIAGISIGAGNNAIKNSKLENLKTNMLLIQAKKKKDLEEVCFQTANLDAKKEEDLAKINEIKKEKLKGIIAQESEVKDSIPQEISIDENCYYLDETNLNEIGVKDLNPEKYGYFIVKYNFENITVEVINTKGYEGKYTLTQLIEE